jgi:hypothetical protein
MLKVHTASYILSADELLEDPVLSDADLFIHIGDVILAQNVAIAHQDVVIVFSEVVSEAGPKQELLQVSDCIVIAVLDLMVPIEFFIDLFISKIDHPVPQVGVLAVP